jgi:S1-C subfamily serine protease
VQLAERRRALAAQVEMQHRSPALGEDAGARPVSRVLGCECKRRTEETRAIAHRPSEPHLLARAFVLVLALAAAFYAGVGLKAALPGLLGAEAAPRSLAERGALRDDERATISLFRDAAPSVVYITTLERVSSIFTRQAMDVPRGTGSGFVWDRRGHIVTNYHVIMGRGRISARVTLSDQSTWDATLAGVAPEKDLAVLRIEAPAERLTPIPIGSSGDLQVGQSVYAIGNPFGLDHTLTTGVISALGREIESLADRRPITDVVQTDAAINPGNSGGPLLDSSGRLIGVNTQIYSTSGASAGIGFAIPVDTVNWVVPDLIEYGRINRPMLGVRLVDDQLLRRYGIEGAMIGGTTRGSGAEGAGLQGVRETRRGILMGDVIVAIDEHPIRSSNDLFLVMEKYRAGDEVTVTVIRDGEEIKARVRLSSSQ